MSVYMHVCNSQKFRLLLLYDSIILSEHTSKSSCLLISIYICKFGFWKKAQGGQSHFA